MPTHTPVYDFRYTEERTGYDVRDIKKILDHEGVPKPSGARYWGNRFIRNVILDDVYKPHSFGEVRSLVAPEVAVLLDPEKHYGIWNYTVVRRRTCPVAEITPDRSRTYTRRSKITVKSSSE